MDVMHLNVLSSLGFRCWCGKLCCVHWEL